MSPVAPGFPSRKRNPLSPTQMDVNVTQREFVFLFTLEYDTQRMSKHENGKGVRDHGHNKGREEGANNPVMHTDAKQGRAKKVYFYIPLWGGRRRRRSNTPERVRCRQKKGKFPLGTEKLGKSDKEIM